MTVRNEEGRYLEWCLNKVRGYVDEVVILDDASSDHTAKLCEMLLKDTPHRPIRNETSMFANESELRKKLWKETPQHCGRFPANIEEFPRCDVAFRIKHFGWARLEDRKGKYERYRRLEPEAIYGIRRQYDSILDSYPHLVQWVEGDCD